MLGTRTYEVFDSPTDEARSTGGNDPRGTITPSTTQCEEPSTKTGAPLRPLPAPATAHAAATARAS